MELKKENREAVILSVILFVLFVIHAFMLDGSYGGGDGIRHYVVSRYSWQHHDQFLYHWGKPFFTLITSPFSQFGLIGIKIFNAFAAALSAYLSYKIAAKLGYQKPIYAVLFSTFAPVYLMCINSGLTEPLFSLILILGIYLFLDNKYFIACIILSFLPFVRSEGNMMLVLFTMVLLFRRKFLLVPLLAFGTLVYSIIGYFYYNDFFWVKNQNPYNDQNAAIYGHGELLHFVNSYDLILGLPIAILFVVGLVWLIIRFAKKPKEIIDRKLNQFEEWFLVLGCFMLYFVAHSIFWWKGIFGSLGLERAIAGAVPLAGIIALRGMQLISSPFKNNKKSLNIVYGIFATLIIIYPLYKKFVPLNLDDEEKVVKEAALWYKNSEYKNEKVYYLHQYFIPMLNIDPYDGKRDGELWGLYPAIKEWGIDVAAPLNTIVLWDAHFGPNEAHIPFDSIMADPNFKLIKTFKPEVPFQTLGGYDFNIYAFLRVKSKTIIGISSETFDLESSSNLGNTHTINEVKPLSGKYSCQMKPENEFGILYERQLDQFANFNSISTVNYSINIYSANELINAQAVMSIDDSSGKSIQWVGKDIISKEYGKWNKVDFSFNIDPSAITPNRKLKIYIWNPGKNSFFVDDVSINLNGYK